MCSCDTRPLRIRVHAPEGRVVLTEGRAGRGWPSPKKARDFARCVAPIVDCICKMRVEGLADNQIAGLFRHAADELNEATMTNDGEVDTAA